jgi:type 1 glutamine amidotransferase
MDRRHIVLALTAGLLAGPVALQHTGAAQDNRRRKKILVVTHATEFRHDSRETAAAVVRFLGAVTHAWDVVADADNKDDLQAWMTADRLKGIALVFFANTTGDLNLTSDQKKAFYGWIKDGGAYAGVHSAADTYHGDADYLDLLRGEFESHGPQVNVVVRNQDPLHPATKNVPETFEIYDEIYLFKNWSRDEVHVLLSMSTHPNKPEVAGDFPVAWTNRVGKGPHVLHLPRAPGGRLPEQGLPGSSHRWFALGLGAGERRRHARQPQKIGQRLLISSRHVGRLRISRLRSSRRSFFPAVWEGASLVGRW